MKKTTLSLIFLLTISTLFAQVTIVDTTTGVLPATANNNYSEPSAETTRFGNTDYYLCANAFTLTQTTQLIARKAQPRS